MKPRYIMATTAIHKMGDISRDNPDIAIVDEETETDYIGNWVTGYGFINVRFPKATSRDLTEEEKDHYRKAWFQISDHDPFQLGIE